MLQNPPHPVSIGLPKTIQGVLSVLGLRKRIQTVFHPGSPPLAGQIMKVKELVAVSAHEKALSSSEIRVIRRSDSTYPPRIGTHNGHFHADEALAVYLLRLLPTYQSSALLRTRDPTLLSTCHTVVDVGGEYSPETNRFDHHQRTFNTTFPARPTKLSSAGLVYLHFGKEIIARSTKLRLESDAVQVIWDKLYTDFIEALDAHDNGINVYDPAETKNLEKRFCDGGVSLGSLVNDLNNSYSDDDDDDDDEEEGTLSTASNAKQKKERSPAQLQAAEDARFGQASEFMGATFLRKLTHYHRSWLPARNLIAKSYKTLDTLSPPLNQVLTLPQPLPWKDHLWTLESAQPASQAPVLYVVYGESSEPDTKWRVQATPVSPDSFESKKALPEQWRGLRDDVLDGVTGVPGGVFVHSSGFIGGNKTKEGALEMAKRAVEA